MQPRVDRDNPHPVQMHAHAASHRAFADTSLQTG
jgi:hypothetical protein